MAREEKINSRDKRATLIWAELVSLLSWRAGKCSISSEFEWNNNLKRVSSKTKPTLGTASTICFPWNWIPFDFARLNRKANTWKYTRFVCSRTGILILEAASVWGRIQKRRGWMRTRKEANARNNYLANEWTMATWNGCELRIAKSWSLEIRAHNEATFSHLIILSFFFVSASSGFWDLFLNCVLMTTSETRAFLSTLNAPIHHVIP